MPLTAKGRRILNNMISEYGEDEGERVFYSSINSGKITGCEKSMKVEKSEESEYEPTVRLPKWQLKEWAQDLYDKARDLYRTEMNEDSIPGSRVGYFDSLLEEVDKLVANLDFSNLHVGQDRLGGVDEAELQRILGGIVTALGGDNDDTDWDNDDDPDEGPIQPKPRPSGMVYEREAADEESRTPQTVISASIGKSSKQPVADRPQLGLGDGQDYTFGQARLKVERVYLVLAVVTKK